MKNICFIFAMLFTLGIQAQVDTSTIVIIPLDTTESWSWNLEGNQSTALNAAQVKLTDSILNVCISENNNNGQPSNFIGMYIGRHRFKKQLVPSVNEKGEVVVWVNCFSADERIRWDRGINWRKQMVIIRDGGLGGGLFNVKINLSTKKYSDLYVNGV